VGSEEGEVQVWDAMSLKQISTFRPGVREVRELNFSPDGKTAIFAGGHNDFRVRLWNVETGESVRDFQGHQRPVHAAAFTPNGQRIVSVSEDRTLRIWDAALGSELGQIPMTALTKCLAIAPDGVTAVTGNGEGIVEVWNLDKRERLAAFARHTGYINSVAVTTHLALSASFDRSVRLWRLPRLADSTSQADTKPATPAAAPRVIRPERRPDLGGQLVRNAAGEVTSASISVKPGMLEKLKEFSEIGSLFLNGAVSDADAATLQSLPKLKYLQCMWSNLSDAGLAELCNCPQLEHIEISGTNVTDAGLARVQSLTKLHHLGIHDALISDAGLAVLKDMPLLDWIAFNRCQITGSGLIHLQALPRLNLVSLNGNPLTAEGFAELSKLQQVTMLQLESCKTLTDDSLQHVGKLTKLRSLSLRGTSITDQGLAHLLNLEGLQSLNLDQTKISDAGLARLEQLKKLVILGLTDVAVSDDAVDRLRQKLPQLRVLGRARLPAAN
jgi:hypothetical protein